MAYGNGWAAWELEKLRELWEQGLSCSQIAAQLNGRTRSSVIGMSHRMHLPPRTSPILRKARDPIENPTKEQAERERRNKYQRELQARIRAEKRANAGAVRAAEKKPEPKPEPMFKPKVKPARIEDNEQSGPMTFAEVIERNLCRWPSGHKPNMTFCGKTRDTDDDPHASYCAEHRRRAFRFHTAA